MPRTTHWIKLTPAIVFTIGLVAALAGSAAAKDKPAGGQVGRSGSQNFVRSNQFNPSFSQNNGMQSLSKKSTPFVPKTSQGASSSGISGISGTSSTSSTFNRNTSRFSGPSTIGTFSGQGTFNGQGTNSTNNPQFGPQFGKIKKQQTTTGLGFPSTVTGTTGISGTTGITGTNGKPAKTPIDFSRTTKTKVSSSGISLPVGGVHTTVKSLPGDFKKHVPTGGVGTIKNPIVSIKPSHKFVTCLPPICPPHCPPHCPKYWPFPVPPIFVITPPIVILPTPVIVVNRTVVVAPRPVLVNQPIDLELVGLQLVDDGSRDEQIGPRYRVWVRNNGPVLHTEFKVTILAANGEEPKPELPNVSGRVSTIEAGQTIAVDLRLPPTASELGRDAQGNAIPFARLFVWIDSAQEIKESKEDNNATMMARTEIPTVEAALAKADEAPKP